MILLKSEFQQITVHLDKVRNRLAEITEVERVALERLIDSYIDQVHYRASDYSIWLRINSLKG